MTETEATISIAVRRDRETGEPVLFFINSNPRGWWIDCYAHVGQHSQASRQYMAQCVPCDPEASDVRALVREWENLGEYTPARIIQRMRFPRTPYIGS